MNPSVAAWENEGGAAIAPSLERRRGPLYGTPSQIEWAERIRVKVDEEFDRIASSFRSVANQQSTRQRAETEAILAIIEEKRSAVLAIDQAGAFIKDWQQIGDQVRRMILDDARFQAIEQRRARRPANHGRRKESFK